MSNKADNVIKLPLSNILRNNNHGELNLLIGTPAYNGMVHIDYLNSIIEYNKAGLPITVMSIGNESLITRGRNTIISYFNNLKQFTHLLFLDSDIYLSAGDLLRLISHDKDVIGAPVALKGYDDKGNSVYNTGFIIDDSNDVVKVSKVGTAVFMLSRKAVDALITDAESADKVYKANPYTRGTSADIPMYDVFQVGVHNGTYLSEDYFVCDKLIELGFDIYVDYSVKSRHNGMYVFE